MKTVNFLGLIPARSGSKGVPDKNIKLLGGYPLIAYSIVASLLSNNIDRTVVTTDSEEYADIARFYGAEVPFIRPKEFSGDRSDAIEYVRHALEWFEKNEDIVPANIVLLCPPSPLRDPIFIDAAINEIIKHPLSTSLRSVNETQESPYKLFTCENGYLKGMFPDDPRPEYYNLPRQIFPKVFHPDGYIDILKANSILKSGSLNGGMMLAYQSPGGGDIDRIEDFEYVEYLLTKSENPIFKYLISKYPKFKPV
jgi:CMP-N,N'-diacetyllegionaminic acid synthase